MNPKPHGKGIRSKDIFIRIVVQFCVTTLAFRDLSSLAMD